MSEEYKLSEIIAWAQSKTPCASHYECLLADLRGLEAQLRTEQPRAASSGALSAEQIEQLVRKETVNLESRNSRNEPCMFQFVQWGRIAAALAAHDQGLKCPICSKPLSGGISWCKTCDVTHAVRCVECHPCGYINIGPCELGKTAAHDQKAREQVLEEAASDFDRLDGNWSPWQVAERLRALAGENERG